MASCKELFVVIYESYDKRHGLLGECLALLTKMEEEFMVATTKETQDDVPDAPLSLDVFPDTQLHLDAVPDAQLHLVALPSAQIHHDVMPPPITTEEILVAVPESQLQLVGPDQSKLASCLERAGPVPVVVSFGAEHTLALVRKLFGGLPGTGNYILVEDKEEHALGRLTVRKLHLIIMVPLRCCCIGRTPWRGCICARGHEAMCACNRTGAWRPPWPPPAEEQLGLFYYTIILHALLRSFWFAAAFALLPSLVDAATGYLAFFTNDICCVVLSEFTLEFAAERNLSAKQLLLTGHHLRHAAPVSAGEASLGRHRARRLVQVGHGEASNTMCTYNRFSAIPACAGARLLTGTNRGDWQLHSYIGLNLGTAPTTSVTEPSGINNCMPAICSTKCVSSVIYVAAPVASYAVDQVLVICSALAAVTSSTKEIESREQSMSRVHAAFPSPVGGVLFALEMATGWRNALLWRTFFSNQHHQRPRSAGTGPERVGVACICSTT